MNNTPTLSAADRFSAFILALIELLVAHTEGKLPAAMVAMIEAQLRRIGEDFARLAASVEKGEPLPSRRERRTRRSAAPRPTQAQKSKLPRREKARTARTPVRAAPQLRLIEPRATYGPKIPARHKPAPWHALFVTIEN